jgi:zinc/manganese transport system substrate-binding protein
MVTTALGGLVGSSLNVAVIVPVGADAHEFAPSAKQAETMENADLLVVNGLGYEEGMGDLIDNAIETGATAFALTGSLEPEEGADPHVWLDPVLMAAVFAELPQVVAETTGVPIDDVQQHVDDYIEQLKDLDNTIQNEFKTTSALTRNLVTNHDSLGHFADRYDFTIIDTIIPSVSTSAEASASDLDEVLTAIRVNDVQAIFSESTDSDALAQALADELGRDFPVVELFTESLGEPGTDADSYVGMMTVNAQRIASALR